jgi:hypothetical protein
MVRWLLIGESDTGMFFPFCSTMVFKEKKGMAHPSPPNNHQTIKPSDYQTIKQLWLDG